MTQLNGTSALLFFCTVCLLLCNFCLSSLFFFFRFRKLVFGFYLFGDLSREETCFFFFFNFVCCFVVCFLFFFETKPFNCLFRRSIQHRDITAPWQVAQHATFVKWVNFILSKSSFSFSFSKFNRAIPNEQILLDLGANPQENRSRN